MKLSKANILIVGAGSVGVFLGVKLRAHNHNVVLLGRKKLQKTHTTILVNDTIYSMPDRVYKAPENTHFDIIFIASKLYDLKKNVKLLSDLSITADHLVSIQNSIVEKDIYLNYKHKTSFGFISVFEGYRLVENQLFVQEGKMGWKTDNSVTGKMVSRLLRNAEINCTTTENIEILKAEKTIMNCSVNLLSAIQKKTFYELFKNKTTRKVIDELFDESYDVLSKKYKLRKRSELKTAFYSLIKPMKHYSSTYQDLIMGHKTEVEFLNGMIVNIGREVSVMTKKNEQILEKFYSLLE